MTPYFFLDKNKEIKGLLIDYWTLWAKKANVEVEFVSTSYLESFSLLKNNEVDFQAGSLYVKDRNSFLDYLEINNNTYLNFFIKRKDFTLITNINDLFGKSVAVLKGSYSLSYLKTNYPKIKLKEYNSYLTLTNSLYDDNVDAIFSESLTLWHKIIKSSDFTSIIKLESFSHRTKIYAGLKKGDKELRELILKGIDDITNEEMSVIENKWIVDESLKYFSKMKKDDILNEIEREYLQKNSLISIATLNNWYQYLHKDKDGNSSGYHIDLLRIINENLETNFSIKIYDSWSKAYSDVKNGKVNSIFGLSWSKKREKIFSFSSSYSTLPTYLIVRKENKNIKNLKDIKNKTVAVIKDSILIEILDKKESAINFIFVKNHLKMLKKVYKKEADIAFLESISKEHLKKYELKVIKTIYTKEGELSIGTSINNKVLSSIMKKAIKSITKEQKIFLNTKWFKKEIDSIFTDEELLYIKNSDILKVGVNNWKPILFSTNGNDMQGIAADILEKIKEISGLRFSSYTAEWHTLLDKFNKGELDILPDTAFLEERLEYGLFTQSYINNPNAIFVNKNNTNIKSLKDLEYKTLAIQKYYAAVTKIKRKYPKIIIKEVLNLNESIKLLLNNEIDAFYDFEVNVKYVLDESLISSIKTIYQNEIKNEKISIY
ncbi:MAG: transporter substrate-binding domain-containing protein [Campylobacteraceae bacterium]|nr:transporter substrate-binding domain-containing protein [Campylobacteraceae bacterium]